MEELDIKTAIQIAKILAAAPDERIPMILDVFSKAQVDINGLDELAEWRALDKQAALIDTGSFTFLPEMSLEYACIIAAKATKLPVEFFKGLHPKEAVKVKNRVTAFFYGAE